MTLSRLRFRRTSLIACALVAACARSASPPPARTPADTAADTTADSAVTATVVIDTTSDTAVVTPAIPPKIRPRPGSLSPLADSIARRLVFVPTLQDTFTAAARGKHMLIDIGRADAELTKPSRIAAYKEAVAARSPLRLGTRLRLRGRWGADDIEVAGFDIWNGRIVATIKGAPRVDSLARKIEPLIAVAQRSDSARPSIDTPCPRDTVDTLLNQRLDAVRDSLLQLLRAGDRPNYPRLQASIKEHSTRITGCFGPGRGLVAVSLVAGDYEWVRERVLLIADDGKAKVLPVHDFRFRGHDLLQAFDADEDGLDDIAARAHTERAGGTVVLRIFNGKSLERVTTGFAYER